MINLPADQCYACYAYTKSFACFAARGLNILASLNTRCLFAVCRNCPSKAPYANKNSTGTKTSLSAKLALVSRPYTLDRFQSLVLLAMGASHSEPEPAGVETEDTPCINGAVSGSRECSRSPDAKGASCQDNSSQEVIAQARRTYR